MRTNAQKNEVPRKSSLPKLAKDTSPINNGVAGSILALQRTIGNQAVQRLVKSNRGTFNWRLPASMRTNNRGKTHSDLDIRGEEAVDEADSRQRSTHVQRNDEPEECKASATGVKLGSSGPIDEAKKYGLRTPIIVEGTNLADVLDSELVGTSIDHTGSMASRPSAKSNNSGFMAADNIPDDRHTSGKKNHLSYYDKHGGDGSYSRLQMDLYKIPSCKIDTPTPIPNSGYRIKREVKKEGDKVVGIVTKTAEEVTIGSHKSEAGLTAKKEAKVTLRE